MIINKDNLISCSKCKTRVPLNDLRADKEGKKWICTSCYSLQHPILNQQKGKLEYEKPINTPRNIDSNKKFRYQCTGCKYIFSRNTEYLGICPYCSKSGTIEIFKL